MVKTFIEEEPKQSLRCIAAETGLNKESVRLILRNQLNRRKLCSVWIPHLLTESNKRERVACANTLINIFDSHSMDEIMKIFAVEDES